MYFQDFLWYVLCLDLVLIRAFCKISFWPVHLEASLQHVGAQPPTDAVFRLLSTGKHVKASRLEHQAVGVGCPHTSRNGQRN